MSSAPPRTRILALVALGAVIAAGLYFFKLHKPGSAASPLAVATAPVSFVTRADAVCNLESQDRLRGQAALAAAGRGGAATSFAAIDLSVRASITELPKLLTITPPPASATLWDRYLQARGQTLSVLVQLRSLARRHATRAQLSSASAPLIPLSMLQRALAARLGLTACASTRAPAPAAAPATAPAGAAAIPPS